MLKLAISLSALVIRWLFEDDTKHITRATYKNYRTPNINLFKAFREDTKVRPIDAHNSDLYALIKSGIVGRPSIIFSRHREKDRTRLRPTDYANAKMCKEILGVDASALYLWCMMQNMPIGCPKRWKMKYGQDDKKCTNTRTFTLNNAPKSKVAHGWLAYMADHKSIFIHHEHSNREVQVGDRELTVDVFFLQKNTHHLPVPRLLLAQSSVFKKQRHNYTPHKRCLYVTVAN